MSQRRKLDTCESDIVVPGPESKRQRHTELGDSQTSVEFKICDDVIDKIMCYLELKDLASVSDAHTRLRAIACRVFSRRHAHCLISMDAYHYLVPKLCDRGLGLMERGIPVYCKHDEMVRISDARTWFKLVRNFGGSMKHVRIATCTVGRATSIRNALDQLVEYISEFCRDSLETFELVGCISLTLNEPLKKLQEFHSDCFENMELLKLLPNLRVLHMIPFPKGTARYFEKLERIDSQLKNDDEVRTFISFLRLNKQIKHLRCYLGDKIAPEQRAFIYTSIANNLTQLKTLKLNGTLQQGAMTRHHFKTVESFSIGHVGPQHVFEFDNLRKVTFNWSNAKLPYVLNFVRRNKKLKILKLGVSYETYSDDDFIRTLLNELPELVEIIVDNHMSEGNRVGLILLDLGLLGKEWEQFDKEKTGRFRTFWAPTYQRFRKIKSQTSV